MRYAKLGSRSAADGEHRLPVAVFGSFVITAGCLGFFQAASVGVAGSDMRKDGMVVTETANGSSIEILRGAVLTIRLETSPGTGYSWKLAKNDQLKLRLIGEDLEIAAKSLPGSTAHKVFRFAAEQSGTSTVELHYLRPWENGVFPKNTYKIQVQTK